MGVWHVGEQAPGLFAHLLTPDGEARQIETLRPTLSELAALPQEMLEDSRRWLGRASLWETEEYWYSHLLAATRVEVPAIPLSRTFGAVLVARLGCLHQHGDSGAVGRVGNLKTDGVEGVIERYCAAQPLGMRLALGVSRAELALEYGDRAGQRVYGSADDLLARYIGQRGQALYDGPNAYGDWP